MKKASFSALLAAVILTACAQSQIHFADPMEVEKALAESEALVAELAAEKIDVTNAAPKPTPAQTAKPESTPEPESVPAPEAELTMEPEQVPATVPQPEPTQEPTSEPAPTSAPAYGAVPFELAAGTDKSTPPTAPIGPCRSRSTQFAQRVACPRWQWTMGFPQSPAADANPLSRVAHSTILA